MTVENSSLAQLAGCKVIVTGASGFIGLNLVKLLSDLNAEVLVIDRIPLSKYFPNVEFEWADLRHLNKIYEADYLIHLAAITNAGYAEKYPIETYEVNVLGLVNLLRHVNIKKRILFPSTALVYGTSQIPLTEESETDLSSTYAQSKMMGEQLVKFYSTRLGVPYTLVRFFNIFGPGQLPLYIVPQVVRQVFEERHIEIRNGAVKRDLLYVDDCIDAVLKLVVSTDTTDSTFNIGSGEIVTISDVAKSAVEASGETGIEITDLEESIAFSPSAIQADITKIQSIVDWYPKTSLKEGLKKMWESRSETKGMGT